MQKYTEVFKIPNIFRQIYKKAGISFDFQWIISIIALFNARKRMISKNNAYDTIAEYGSSCRKRQMKLSEKKV